MRVRLSWTIRSATNILCFLVLLSFLWDSVFQRINYFSGYYEQQPHHVVSWWLIVVYAIAIPLVTCSMRFFAFSHAWKWEGLESGFKIINTQNFLFLTLMLYLVVSLDYYLVSKLLGRVIPYKNLDFLRTFGQGMAFGCARSLMLFSAQKIEDLSLRELEGKAELEKAKIAVIAGQMHPHVLFNMLSCVDALILKAPEHACKYLNYTVDFLYGVIDVSKNRLTTMAREYELIQEYMRLETLKLGDKLQVEWHWDENTDNTPVPPLVSQILAENAIKHGIIPNRSKDGGKVRISASKMDGYIRLEVANTGGYYEPKPESEMGIGLKNIMARMKIHYGDHGKLHIESKDGWTTASLVFPVEPQCA